MLVAVTGEGVGRLSMAVGNGVTDAVSIGGGCFVEVVLLTVGADALVGSGGGASLSHAARPSASNTLTATASSMTLGR